MNEVQRRLSKEFRDGDYAPSYMNEHVDDKIAAQLYWTRKRRGWSQAELAKRSGIAQERISKIENGESSSLTMKTLRKFAAALDVHVNIEFVPYSHAVIHASAGSRKEDLELAGRDESLDALDASFATLPPSDGGSCVILGSSSGATAYSFKPVHESAGVLHA